MAIRKKRRKSAPVGVIGKVLRILELLNQFPEGLHLKDVAEKSGINKSTALRFLSHLEQEYYLLRDADGAFLPGPKLVRFGRSKSFEATLCKISRPIMEDLGRTTHETVNLGVLEGFSIMLLDVLESPHRLSVVSQVGSYGETYCTALGKAILANMDEGPRREEILASIHFVAKTPRTLMSIARLKEDLIQTRKRGFSHDDEETFVGVRCVGAAILGVEGNVIGAISVDGPISRVSRERLPFYSGLVQRAARDISSSFGYRPPQLVKKLQKSERKPIR